MNTSTTDMSSSREQLQSDAGMFGLLARLWIREVDLTLLEHLQCGEIHQSFTDVGGYVPPDADETTLEQLAIEFCACFLGPKGHLPPYQSVVQDSNFQSKCIESIRSYIDVIGQPSGMFAEQKMLDHAGLQLSLMQTICHAAAQSSDEDYSSLLELRNSFYRDHLSWIEQYCSVARRKSESKFYSSIFAMTSEFLSHHESNSD